MARHIKYIADGFHEDSANLLNDFVDLGSVEFSDFAFLWRKHYFSLIFMGRPDDIEMTEFVNETFRITSQYLFSPSFYQQVGAVYTLYSLFLNQISEPPIQIRLELNHWKVIRSLLDDAFMKKYKTLHYVIDYLCEHAFVFCANQVLKGPLTGNTPKAPQTEAPTSNLRATYKQDILKYSVSTNLSALHNLNKQYLAEKKNISGANRFNLTEGPDIYVQAISELNEIVNPSSPTQVGENVGSRRAKIKAKSFITKSKNRFGLDSDTEDSPPPPPQVDPEYESPVKTKPTRKQRRVPKSERRVGRPSRKPKIEPPTENKSDDDMDISHLLPQQEDFYLPPIIESKKSRTKRDPYYQLSPRREDSDSDIEMT